MKIYIEDTAGNKYECEISNDTEIATIAADFFEAMEWPEEDMSGHGQRAVVELVQKGKFGRHKAVRLRSDETIQKADIVNGMTLRIYPEAIAGALDANMHQAALIADHRAIRELAEENPYFEYETVMDFAPTKYTLRLRYRSFIEPPTRSGISPKIGSDHSVKVELPANYPFEPPVIYWVTPIFHPNINQKRKDVCLGRLGKRYLPGLGLARIVSMLIEIIQWRNYDAIVGAYNGEAANWAFKARKLGFYP